MGCGGGSSGALASICGELLPPPCASTSAPTARSNATSASVGCQPSKSSASASTCCAVAST
eukprot:4969835-Prymnesium_polylepis.1